MRILLAVLLVASACSMKGQETENPNCMLLRQIMETPIFNREFSFTENLNEQLIIVDTSKVFSECHINTVKERRVTITNTMPSKKEMVNNKNILILSAVQKKDCFISFGFWNYGTGRTLAIHYEIENEGYRLLGYKLGDF